MSEPIIGTEAMAAGALTRGALRWNYTAIHPNVYLRNDARRDLYINTFAAWLWTGRKGVIAGPAAAALYGVGWIRDTVPVELIAKHGRRRPGIVVRDERISEDEVSVVAGLPVTSPARTALDLARHLPRDEAVAHVDALAAVTNVTLADVMTIADRYPRTRGIGQAPIALHLMDGGARSTHETRIRLLLIDAGLPRPRTNIAVGDDMWESVIALGWDGPMVGVGYEEHRGDGYRAVQDIACEELFQRTGWMHIRVRAEHTPSSIVHRVRTALLHRAGSRRRT